MSRKRKFSQKRKKGPAPRRDCRGVPSLVFGGVMFAVAGALMIAKPIPFFSSGAIGRRGRGPIMNVTTEEGTTVLGVCMILIAVALLAVALRIARTR